MKSYSVKVNRTKEELLADESTSLLDSFIQNKIKVKYNCYAGYCGACRVKLVEGEVLQSHSGGISKKEQDDNFILLCCSFPLSDLVIKR